MDSTFDDASCTSFQKAVELIGRRWTGVIVRAMLGGAECFSSVKRNVPGLSDRMLSERLKELEAEGVVERHVFPETPVRIEYRITEKGRALAAVVESIGAWATEWQPEKGDAASPARSPAEPAGCSSRAR